MPSNMLHIELGFGQFFGTNSSIEYIELHVEINLSILTRIGV